MPVRESVDGCSRWLWNEAWMEDCARAVGVGANEEGVRRWNGRFAASLLLCG
jgi:hypothetical protein